ncbi:hypothetical protein BP6252_02496 [Coleophoma cylindrospora]|uniref:Uncharacterized protein n=1 Tax=Coleophoma cylindrospora TaxID=1849047 RepID=A0A3D8SF43_9HELO|nr:hypothetical protein BP6252_02496 [Coleophoma cylindrospora]
MSYVAPPTCHMDTSALPPAPPRLAYGHCTPAQARWAAEAARVWSQSLPSLPNTVYNPWAVCGVCNQFVYTQYKGIEGDKIVSDGSPLGPIPDAFALNAYKFPPSDLQKSITVSSAVTSSAKEIPSPAGPSSGPNVEQALDAPYPPEASTSTGTTSPVNITTSIVKTGLSSTPSLPEAPDAETSSFRRSKRAKKPAASKSPPGSETKPKPEPPAYIAFQPGTVPVKRGRGRPRKYPLPAPPPGPTRSAQPSSTATHSQVGPSEGKPGTTQKQDGSSDGNPGAAQKQAEAQEPSQAGPASQPASKPVQARSQARRRAPKAAKPAAAAPTPGSAQWLSAVAAGVAEAILAPDSGTQEGRQAIYGVGKGLGKRLMEELERRGNRNEQVKEVAEAWAQGVFKGVWFPGLESEWVRE